MANVFKEKSVDSNERGKEVTWVEIVLCQVDYRVGVHVYFSVLGKKKYIMFKSNCVFNEYELCNIHGKKS